MPGRKRQWTDAQLLMVAGLAEAGMPVATAQRLCGVEISSAHYHIEKLEATDEQLALGAVCWAAAFAQRVLNAIELPEVELSIEQASQAAGKLAEWADDALFCISGEATVETGVLTHG